MRVPWNYGVVYVGAIDLLNGHYMSLRKQVCALTPGPPHTTPVCYMRHHAVSYRGTPVTQLTWTSQDLTI